MPTRKRDELVKRIEQLAEEAKQDAEPEIGYLLCEIAETAKQHKKKGLKLLMGCVSEHQASILAESCVNINS